MFTLGMLLRRFQALSLPHALGCGDGRSLLPMARPALAVVVPPVHQNVRATLPRRAPPRTD